MVELLEIDEVQARAVMNIQARWLSQPHHLRMVAEYDRLVAMITDREATLSSPERLRQQSARSAASIWPDRTTADIGLTGRDLPSPSGCVRWRVAMQGFGAVGARGGGCDNGPRFKPGAEHRQVRAPRLR